MKYRYKCDACGCYLDPGEGRICEECRESSERRSQKMRAYSKMYIEQRQGQYEMRLREAL